MFLSKKSNGKTILYTNKSIVADVAINFFKDYQHAVRDSKQHLGYENYLFVG